MRPRCAGRECRSPKLLCRSIRFSPNMKQQGGFHGACSCRARTANPFAWNCRLLKLDPALSVGAQGGVRYGFHPMCRTWHIWSLPAAIKPRVSGVRVYCFLFVDFLPMPVDSEYIRCLNARAKMHVKREVTWFLIFVVSHPFLTLLLVWRAGHHLLQSFDLFPHSLL